MGKILQICLKLNFSPNTLGCYGLTSVGKSLPYSVTLSLSAVFNTVKRLFHR